jgi:hypothetical protein
MRGVIERRILANFRVDPDVLANVLPSPFRPKIVNDMGIAGICLIRLKQLRPRFAPAFLGISSENAAHRFAVEWDHNGETKEGVYIPRRDTSSRLNTLLGGRIFPGFHHHAHYDVRETDDQFCVVLDSDDDDTHVAVEGHVTKDLPAGSIFRSIQEASDFFQRGSLGYSATRTSGAYDGLELRTFDWRVESLAVDRVESSYFEDRKLFPAGTIEFDCALLMRDIKHEWHGRPSLFAESVRTPPREESALTTK